MSAGQRFYLLSMQLVIPFAVAAAFHYSTWLGWPALFVGALYWIGCFLALTEKRK